MHVFSIVCVLLCVACSCMAKPYHYSYYISSPNHYQTVEVNDGDVSVDGAQFPTRPNGPENPAFRQGRGGFGGNRNPYPPGRYPSDQNEPNYRREWSPNYPDMHDRDFNPQFNRRGQIPENRGGVYHRNNGPYEGDFDYRFNQVDPNQRRPSFQQDNFNYYHKFQGLRTNPEIRNQDQASNPQYATPNQRADLTQEIDESSDTEKEEVTTSQPCSFCGVDRVNTRDGINGDNVDSDSEPVEPKMVGGKSVPTFAVDNSAVTPASVIIPYYVLT
ncbi:hypothetical protein D910_12593 [Dendroctonus ponderosae]|uniref:Uncharacterized protein n=1 Tax=Dendroctonus ponderosae TaxID=77166 RepID=U4UQH5_DENPD|nr:hypothetical protein D910_12593 [Dendroctonus ponderosae]